MPVRTIAKSYYNTSEVIGLTETVINLIEDSSVKDDPTVQILKNKLGLKLELLKTTKGKVPDNVYTEETGAADSVRDLSFRAFVTYIKALTLRQNESIQKTALAVWEHIKKYDRNLINYGYADESVELEAFITEMEEPVTAGNIAQLQATEWLNELKAGEANFKGVYKTWFDEEAKKQAILYTVEAREDTLNILTALLAALNNLEIAEIPDVTELNFAVDQAVEEFESKARARRTRRNNTGDDNTNEDN